jgi:hypothetical protein
MISRVKIFRTLIAAPVLCLGLLGAVAVDASRQQPPPEVDAYHQSIAALVEKEVPWMIPQANPKWTGQQIPIPEAAQKLLKPNAIVSRGYVDNSPSESRGTPRWANLLLEQCRDSSDMDGHWPPNCYPNKGEKLEFEAPREWTIGGHTIRLTEYHFVQATADRVNKRCVYNFLIVPGFGTTRSMDDVRKAATDYRQRYYGSAQVQVIMDGDLPQNEREEIFADLVTPLSNVISAINSGGPK